MVEARSDRPDLLDIAGAGWRQSAVQPMPIRGPLGRAVVLRLARRGVLSTPSVEQGSLQAPNRRRLTSLRAVAAGPVSADGGDQRIAAGVEVFVGDCSGAAPVIAVIFASADHCGGVTCWSKPSRRTCRR